MIDLSKLTEYRENNRIEAKKSLGGLPHSIWETYSAFANTMGGVILLGVEEYRDRSFHTVDLPDPEGLIIKFRAILNDREKVSANVLTDNDVTVEEVNGDHIVVIRVPRADRFTRPVYVGGNARGGAYRRNGEGDYHCTAEEFDAMIRDAAVSTPDMEPLPQYDASVFDEDGVRGFRRRLSLTRPGHYLEDLCDDDFLVNVGAAVFDANGKLCPTGAGILMFGKRDAVKAVFPGFSATYRDGNEVSCGDNLYGFFFRVYDRLSLVISSVCLSSERTPLHIALREALTNCIVNADYGGSTGITVVRNENGISFSNPGNFRVNPRAALEGGISDPRNCGLLKMFIAADMAGGTGNGLSAIFEAWQTAGLALPVISESLRPDVITLSLEIKPRSEKATPAGSIFRKRLIISFLTDRISADVSEISRAAGVGTSRTGELLRQLTDENVVVWEHGANGKKIYRLKS